MYDHRMQERFKSSSPPSSGGSPPDYSPTRRTAVVLVGEGTSIAYLVGAYKALLDAGVRVDLVVGKGVGAIVAAFGAIQAGEKLWGGAGLLWALTQQRPWRLRAPYLAILICMAGAFGVFISPALLGMLLLITLPLLAAARIIAPGSVDVFYNRFQDTIASFALQLDPIYLRAIAFPVALVFALILIRWVLPAFFRRGESRRGLGRFFGEGVVDLVPFKGVLERGLWEAVRGASVEARPSQRTQIGQRYRDLLSASFGQLDFCELIFYALDLNTGQEVPFVLLKERWLSRMQSRGPGQGAVAAEPLDLAGDAAPLLFDALVSSVSPPSLAPSQSLRLPLEGRYGGEVHRFTSSLLAGQSAVSDAVAAGAQQVIYISGASASGDPRAGGLTRLSDAAVRQTLENDLQFGNLVPSRPALFVVRPDKSRLGTYEFSGRSLYGEERLEMAALVAHGERDMTRMFIQPLVGHVGRPQSAEGRLEPGEAKPPERESWGTGPESTLVLCRWPVTSSNQWPVRRK